jgi:hypothetical protein
MSVNSVNGSTTPLSPNAIINGNFEINQRLFSSGTSSGYGFDRWTNITDGTGATFSSQQFPVGTSLDSNSPSKNFWRVVTSGQNSTSGFSILTQRIENVERFAGKSVTVSFYARAATGTPKVAIEINQNFGTGGAPSSEVNNFFGHVTLSTTWQRYSVTGVLPLISGKTLGSAGDFLGLSLWVSAGSSSNSRSGSLGIQSNTFDIWGVQLEEGTAATPFRRNASSIQGELAACQRYYWRFDSLGASGGFMPFAMAHGIDSNSCRGIIRYPVTMRRVPSLAFSSASTFTKSFGNPMTSVVGAEIGFDSASVQWGRSGEFAANQGTLITANNTNAAHIVFESEL